MPLEANSTERKITMRKSVAIAAGVLMLSSVGAAAVSVKTVGGAPMYPNKTVVENASKAHNLTAPVRSPSLHPPTLPLSCFHPAPSTPSSSPRTRRS